MIRQLKIRSAKRRRSCHRRGIASLEFVLGVPFIMALGGMIVMMAFAGLSKTKSTIESRHAAFKKRSSPPDSEPLYLFSSADAGAIVEEKAIDYKVYNWLGGQRKAVDTQAVLGGTWDHRQIEEFTQSPKIPHFASLARIAGADSGDVELINGAAVILFSLFGGSLPNQDEIDQAKGDAEDAENEIEEAEEKRDEEIDKEIEQRRKEIERLRKEIERLEAEKKPLVEEKGRLEEDQTREEEALDDLLEEAAEYGKKDPPEDVPQELKDRIEAQRDKIQAIKDRIKEINDEISEIDRQIRELEAQIRRLEAEIRELEGMKS